MAVKKLLIIGGLILVLGSGSVVFLNTQSPTTSVTSMTESEIQDTYGPLQPIYFGQVLMRASVADTDEERQRGLSLTPSLPIWDCKVICV